MESATFCDKSLVSCFLPMHHKHTQNSRTSVSAVSFVICWKERKWRQSLAQEQGRRLWLKKALFIEFVINCCFLQQVSCFNVKFINNMWLFIVSKLTGVLKSVAVSVVHSLTSNKEVNYDLWTCLSWSNVVLLLYKVKSTILFLRDRRKAYRFLVL